MSVLVDALLAGALLASPPGESADAVEREVHEILAEDRYMFCAADTTYVPRTADLRWCELAEQVQYRGCPGYEQVCHEAGSSGSVQMGPGGGSQEGEQVELPPEPDPEPPERKDVPPPSGWVQVLMWVMLGALLVWAIAVLLRNFVRDRSTDDDEPTSTDDASSSLIAAKIEAARRVETDVQRLLARAEAAAAAGRHDDAIADVHAALLRRLEGQRLIAVGRWKTNGDYLQALRQNPSLRDEVRTIVREVEQVQFGSAAASPDRYASVRAKVVAIVTRATLVLALALCLGTQTACDEEAPQQTDTSTLPPLGTGPAGQRALGQLLVAHDIEVDSRWGGFEQLALSHGAIVLVADVEPSDEEWTKLLAWVESGGVLVVATGLEFPRRLKVDYVPAPLQPGDTALYDDVRHCCAAPPGRSLRSDAAHEVLLTRKGDRVNDPWARDLPYALRRELGDGQLVVFAEADMWTNAALLIEHNAAFLLELLELLDVDRVEFVRAKRMGSNNPFESMRNAKLGALFLQVLLFLALLYAAVGIPFARLRDPPARRRRAFAEHVRTLGQRYAQARAAHHVAALYGGWALDRLRARLQPGGSRGMLELAQAIAARTGRPQAEIMQILVEAHSLRDASGHADASSDTRDTSIPASSAGGRPELELMRALSDLLDQTR